MRKRPAQTAVTWVILAAALVAAGAGVVLLIRFSRPVVTVTRVVEGPVVEAFYATGTIQPVTEYPIKASNAGVITKLLVDKGQRVKEGEVLAVVEDPPLQFQLDKSRAELEQARRRADEKTSPVLREFDSKLEANVAMWDNARREEQRIGEVIPKGGASRSDQEKAADRVKELWSQGESLKAQRLAAAIGLQTDLRVAEAAEAAAQRSFNLQTLRAPADGVVLDRPTPLGTRLNINDHLMQIADVRPQNLVMRAQVDEENMAELHDGQAVRMTLYSFPARTFEGKVTRIYDKADTDRRTFEADVRIDPLEPRLAAGMTGELAFIMSAKQRALVAPAQALQAGKLYSLHNGRLTKVSDARVGIKSVERIELIAGFHPGDLIVISSVQGLSEGTRVRATFMDPVVAAGLNKPDVNSTFKGFN